MSDGFPNDNEKELCTAEYCSPDGLSKYKAEIRKHRLLAEALEAGVPGIDPEQVNRAAQRLALRLDGLARTYTLDAIRAGSFDDKGDLDRYIRDQRDEDPAETE